MSRREFVRKRMSENGQRRGDVNTGDKSWEWWGMELGNV